MSTSTTTARQAPIAAHRRPRLGFLGVGWIGRSRLEAIARCGMCDLVAAADPDERAVEAACATAPALAAAADLDELLAAGVDGVVIATPSGQHADQSIRALEAGAAVFCQKPLGRTAAEAGRVVRAARCADRLLGVDMSYRHCESFSKVAELARSGELGELCAIDLTFHNAYGPDKPWFFDPALSGGGCVLDLGVHMVDLALWALAGDPVAAVDATLYADARPLRCPPHACEDRAYVQMRTAGGVTVRLACSWNLHLGRDAEIAMTVQGREGGAEARNISGSFFDFEAWRLQGTDRRQIARPPDAWFGRAAAAWARRLAVDASFDPAVAEAVATMRLIDRIYGRNERTKQTAGDERA